MGGTQFMGGYGPYLIVAYGVTAVVIVGNIFAARRRLGVTQRRLREQLDRRSRRSGSGRASPDPAEIGPAEI